MNALNIPIDEIGAINHRDGLGFIQPTNGGTWIAVVRNGLDCDIIRNSVGPIEYADPGRAWESMKTEIEHRTKKETIR